MNELGILLIFLSAGTFIAGKENQAKNDIQEIKTEEVELSGDGELESRSAQTMTNIGYLFRGYNVIKGNPLDPERFDPGFRGKIFQAAYSEDRKTDDLRYKIPDSVDVVTKTTCRTSYSAETVSTLSDYQNSLMAKASVSGSGRYKVVKASFSASIEYNRVRKTLESNDKSIIKTEAMCTVYEAILQTGSPPSLTESFLNAIKEAKRTKQYGAFLDTFGTHFIESIDMGARISELQEISKENQESLQTDGIDIKRAAEVSVVGLGSVSTEQQLKVDRTATEKYNQAIENKKTVTIGSKPPADGKTSTWVESTAESPLPIFYRLKSITELFSPTFIKDFNDEHKKIKRQLIRYLKNYCKGMKETFPDVECEGPPKGCGGGSQCSANADCIDSPSSENEQQYTCRCKQGYQGNGQICSRIPKWTMTNEIKHSENVGWWGTWGGFEYCAGGVFASGFTLRAEESQKAGDDTGANGVCIRCGDKDVCSKYGQWGQWSDVQLCPKGSFLTGWRQNVEDNQGNGDDTALDNVEYRCRDLKTWEVTDTLKTNAEEWGRWSRWKECDRGDFICGINTRVEDPDGDDTALNDIKHQCCKPLLKKKAKKSGKAKKN